MRKPSVSSTDIIAADTPHYRSKAAAVIRSGGIVAIPTETYYGLAVDPFNETALEYLFAIKRRTPDKPVLVLIEHLSQLADLVVEIPDRYQSLFDRYWPGPLTLIFAALPHLSSLLTGRTATVGVRKSSSHIATQICNAVNGPITATSANISGMAPARNAAEVMEIFGTDLDLIVDGGETRATSCSTVVKENNGMLTLVRAGEIDFFSICNH